MSRFSSPESSSSEPFVGWKLGLIILAALALRLFYADGQSITFDEFYEIQLAKQDIPHILVRGDGFPPLYSLCLHFWDMLFGSESGRILSILAGSTCCLGMYVLGKTVGGKRVGLYSAALSAALPLHLFYSSEIRAYPLLLLATTFALNSLIHATRHDRWRDWLIFSAVTAIGLHTHYLFAIFAAMTLLLSLLYVRSVKPFVSGALIICLLVPLTLYCVQADLAMQQGWAYRVNFGIGELAFTYGSFLMGYTLGPSLRQLHVLWTRDAIFYALPWASFFGIALGGIFYAAKKNVVFRHREFPIFATLAFAPLVVGILCKLAGIGYQVRYSIWAMIPIAVLIAMFLESAMRKKIGKLAAAFLFGLFALAMVNRHYVASYQNADLATAAARLADSAISPKHPVLVVSGYMVEPLKFYLPQSEWELKGISMESPFEARESQMTTLLDELRASDSEFWLMYTREFHEDPDGRLMEMIRENSEVEFISEYPGLKLYRAKFRDAEFRNPKPADEAADDKFGLAVPSKELAAG